MLWHRTRRLTSQAQSCTSLHSKDLARIGSWPACVLACIAAILLIFSAGAQNVSYGWQLGTAHSEFRAVILALASAGATLLAPLCFAAVAQCWRSRNFGAGLVALVLGVAALTYAAVCSLGFVAGSRDTVISAHTVAIEDRQDKRALAKAAHEELSKLKGQRPDVVERRAELTAILVELSKAKPGQRAAARPDSQAAGVAFVLSAAGWKVSESDVGQWINIGTVLFLELAAALSLTVAAALYPSTRRNAVEGARMHEAPAPGPALPKSGDGAPTSNAGRAEASREDDEDDPPLPPSRGKRGRPATVLPAEAVARLRKAGGGANGTVRGVSRLLGTKSRTATRRLLHRLSEAGLIRLQMTPAGCSVALA